VISPIASRGDGRVVVVGGGLAGATCAAAVARRGRSVLLVEAESGVGRHSSGRNAGLIRQAIEDPVLSQLCREGAQAIHSRGVTVSVSGSILICAQERIPASVLEQIEHRKVEPDELSERYPWLRGADLGGAVETPTDGIVEPKVLLDSYLEEIRDLGGEIRCGEAALEPVIETIPRGGRRVRGIVTESGLVSTDALIVATGAWGARWGEYGGVPIALFPTLRSLVSVQFSATRWPRRNFADRPVRRAKHIERDSICGHDLSWVWHLREGWYFRPERGGLLWCAGEELGDSPSDAVFDRDAPRRLAEVIERSLPALGNLHVWRHWSGHRSFLPDRRFLLGPDPRLEGWYWAVGLGGHGVTASAAVGTRVAASLEEGVEAIEPELAFRPNVTANIGVSREV